MGFAGCIPRFIKANGGWIFTVLSAVGLVGTTILVANEAPVVDKELKSAEEEKGEELTVFEKADIAIPLYLPSIFTGGLTIGCIIGAQLFNLRQQKLILAAYAMLGQEYAQYRKEVRETVGKEKEREIYISSQKKIRELQAENEKLKLENSKQLYAITTIPGLIFESTPEHMNNVFYHIMYNLLNLGGVSLLEFYDHIGIPNSAYDNEFENTEKYGWEVYENEITYGCSAVEFEIENIKRKDGKIIHLINPSIPPYKLGLDYGMSDSSVDHEYGGYDYEHARFLAEASFDGDVEKFDQPELWFCNSL